MRTLILAALAGTMALPSAPVFADPPGWAQANGRRDNDRRWNGRDRDRVRYDRQGRYVEPRRLTRNDRVWRGQDGRYYCRRDNGTTGLIIGAAVGGLLGNQIAGRGDKTLGTIIGAAGGGLLGRTIDRGDLKCR